MQVVLVAKDTEVCALQRNLLRSGDRVFWFFKLGAQCRNPMPINVHLPVLAKLVFRDGGLSVRNEQVNITLAPYLWLSVETTDAPAFQKNRLYMD